MNFEVFSFHPSIQTGIRSAGFTVPTNIQHQTIPPILKGRDVMGLAPTGTGKTAAFVLPILERLLAQPLKKTRALILAPTRELAEQTHDAFGQLGRHTPVKSVAVYGGVNKNPQIAGLRRGAEVVVACPGRLIDLMDQGAVDLSCLEVLVLDEADRMFDMGFLPDIRRILGRIPSKRQTLLFSATMPDDIRRLAREILQDPEVVQIGHAAPVDTVSHALYPVPQHLKTALLMKLLHRTDTGSVLIFTRTKKRAMRLAMQMKKAGFPVAALQGDLSQHERTKALNGFRTGRYRMLVATDIAARGLDVTRISHVINYDIPDSVDAYTHRIGRTGRAARTGDAFTFVTPVDMETVCNIEQVLGQQLEMRRIEGFDYDTPAPERRDAPRETGRPGGGFRAPVAGRSPASGALFRGVLPFYTARPKRRRILGMG